jgi:hypothetical protein
VDRPQQAAGGEHGARRREEIVATAVDGHAGFGHEDPEDEAGDGTGEAGELVLAEDRRAQRRDRDRSEESED